MSAGGHQQLTATVPAGEATAWYHPAGINKASPTSMTTVQAAGCRAASSDEHWQWCGDADHAGSAPKSAPDAGGSNTTVLRPLSTVRILWLSSQCGADDVAPVRNDALTNCRGPLMRRLDSLTATSTVSRRRGIASTPSPRPRQVQVHFLLSVTDRATTTDLRNRTRRARAA